METISQLFQLLKTFFLPLLVRWVLKIGGTWVAVAGWEEDELSAIIGGILSIVFGIVISLVNKKDDLESQPK